MFGTAGHAGHGIKGRGIMGPGAGWYPDPTLPETLRYWDGERWTSALRQAEPATPPVTAEPEPAAGGRAAPPPRRAPQGAPSLRRAPRGVLIAVVLVLASTAGGLGWWVGISRSTVPEPVTEGGGVIDEATAPEVAPEAESTTPPAAALPLPTAPASFDLERFVPAPPFEPPLSGVLDVVLARGETTIVAGLVRRSGVASNEAWLTEDGQDWRTIDLSPQSGSEARFGGGAANTSAFVLVGSAAGSGVVVLHSSDGSEWTRAEVPDLGPDARLESVVWAETQFVAVGSRGDRALILASPDGLVWEAVATEGDEFARAALESVASRPGLIIAGGSQLLSSRSTLSAVPVVWASADGRSWRQVFEVGPTFTGSFVSVAASPMGFIAVGLVAPAGWGEADAGIWWSEDGIAWEWVVRPRADERTGIDEVIATKTSFVGVGTSCPDADLDYYCDGDGSGGVMMMTSSNGRDWERVSFLPFAGWVDVASLAIDARGLVAVGEDFGGGPPAMWRAS